MIRLFFFAISAVRKYFIKLSSLSELNIALEYQTNQTKLAAQIADREAQITKELEVQIARYQQRFGESPAA